MSVHPLTRQFDSPHHAHRPPSFSSSLSPVVATTTEPSMLGHVQVTGVSALSTMVASLSSVMQSTMAICWFPFEVFSSASSLLLHFPSVISRTSATDGGGLLRRTRWCVWFPVSSDKRYSATVLPTTIASVSFDTNAMLLRSPVNPKASSGANLGTSLVSERAPGVVGRVPFAPPARLPASSCADSTMSGGVIATLTLNDHTTEYHYSTVLQYYVSRDEIDGAPGRRNELSRTCSLRRTLGGTKELPRRLEAKSQKRTTE